MRSVRRYRSSRRAGRKSLRRAGKRSMRRAGRRAGRRSMRKSMRRSGRRTRRRSMRGGVVTEPSGHDTENVEEEEELEVEDDK